MESAETIVNYLEGVAGLNSVQEVRTFTGYLRGQFVTIEVRDAGRVSDSRYWVIARDSSGRQAATEGAPTLHEAIVRVHWDELDRDH